MDTYFNCDGNSFYSGYIASGTGFQKSIGPCGSVRLSRSLTYSLSLALPLSQCSFLLTASHCSGSVGVLSCSPGYVTVGAFVAALLSHYYSVVRVLPLDDVKLQLEKLFPRHDHCCPCYVIAPSRCCYCSATGSSAKAVFESLFERCMPVLLVGQTCLCAHCQCSEALLSST